MKIGFEAGGKEGEKKNLFSSWLWSLTRWNGGQHCVESLRVGHAEAPKQPWNIRSTL